jgi:hypothetical protein
MHEIAVRSAARHGRRPAIRTCALVASCVTRLTVSSSEGSSSTGVLHRATAAPCTAPRRVVRRPGPGMRPTGPRRGQAEAPRAVRRAARRKSRDQSASIPPSVSAAAASRRAGSVHNVDIADHRPLALALCDRPPSVHSWPRPWLDLWTKAYQADVCAMRSQTADSHLADHRPAQDPGRGAPRRHRRFVMAFLNISLNARNG